MRLKSIIIEIITWNTASARACTIYVYPHSAAVILILEEKIRVRHVRRRRARAVLRERGTNGCMQSARERERSNKFFILLFCAPTQFKCYLSLFN